MLPISIFRKFRSCLVVLITIILLSVNKTLQQVFLCGIPQISRTELIVPDRNTTAGAWPWHAAIYHRNQLSESYACGGTLISTGFVLTAAYCVLNTENEQQLETRRIFVRLGLHNLDLPNSKTVQQHNISRIHQPNSNGDYLRNNIAILELATLAERDKYVQPACLGSSENLVNQYGTVIGWGATDNDEGSRILQSALMPVVDLLTCLKSDRDLFGRILDEGMFCAGYTNGTSMCNGYSGGGLFFKVDNAWYLEGIVSFISYRDETSNPCHTRDYVVFTKVSAYLPWISSVTESKEVSLFDFLDVSLEQPKTTTSPASGGNLQLLPKDCGLRVDNRLAFGNVTKVFSYPWMAVLRYNYNGEIVDGCGGSLINKRYILTAAYCLKTRSFIPIHSVVLGEHTKGQEVDCKIYRDSDDIEIKRDCAEPVEVFGIESFEVHQDYNRPKYSNDIGLIRLDREVVMKDHIKPICLPVTPELQRKAFANYIVTGWGTTENQTGFNILLEAVLPHVDVSECQLKMNENRLSIRLSEKQMCAGGKNRVDTCKGDSGGPLGFIANYNDAQFVQFGIVSFREGSCGQKSVPGIYCRVGAYMDWIAQHIKP